jgi:hypothetical protein
MVEDGGAQSLHPDTDPNQYYIEDSNDIDMVTNHLKK